MTIKKLQLISNSISYGPMPRPDKEVEQHLTINDRGQVWFSRYRFGDDMERHPLIRKEYSRIPDEDAKEILKLSEAVINAKRVTDETDTGYWELTVTDANGEIRRKDGSLIYSDSKAIQDLCRRIRTSLKDWDLFLLDGYDREAS